MPRMSRAVGRLGVGLGSGGVEAACRERLAVDADEPLDHAILAEVTAGMLRGMSPHVATQAGGLEQPGEAVR